MNDACDRHEKYEAGDRKPWFVVQLKPNAAAAAKRNLARQGVEIFAPFEEITNRVGGNLVLSRRPLFPGYLFVRFDAMEVGWRAINSTLGVIRLVGFAGRLPVAVPEPVMANLLERCDAAGKLHPPKTLSAGEVARVAKGPFAGFLGRVEQAAPDRRIWMLLDVLGKSTRVAISVTDLRAE